MTAHDTTRPRPKEGMNPGERRAILALSGIYAFRMLGLFLILPVFSLYATDSLEGATPALIGLAIGAYGLAQAILQIPLGMLSDRFGRKPIIIIGLLIFALGSVIAALADSITGVIIGRILQGSGAIAAAVLALAADLTREQQRTKAMAAFGITIGLSFAFALIMGPIFNAWFGVPGIFWLTALLALAGIALLQVGVPKQVKSHFHRDTQPVPACFKEVLGDVRLMRLNFGIFALHTILLASFVALPLALRDQAGLAAMDHWQVYLPVVLLSMVAMIPFIILAEKKRLVKQVFLGAVIVLGLSELGLFLSYQSVAGIAFALFLFFTAFNVLEANLPSLISKIAPPESKGTAMGIYSTAQFLGAFLGGTMGGLIYGAYGLGAVFIFCAAVAGLWVLSALGMQTPKHLKSHMLNVGTVDTEQAQRLSLRLREIPGVVEAVVVVEDGIAYLRVDSKLLDEAALDAFLVAKA